MIQIKTFGKLTEIINKEPGISLPVSMEDFRKQLEVEFPKLQQSVYKIAVNDQIINDPSFVIQGQASIALLPPFSGG